MKRAIHFICVLLCSAVLLTFFCFLFAFLGNPVSWTVARINASRYLDQNCRETDFRITKVQYNFKTSGYYAHISAPSSRDRYFTVYFDGWGQYKNDTYSDITERYTTLSRLNEQYRELVKGIFPYGGGNFDVSIGYGELRESGLYEMHSYIDKSGNTVHYTLNKEYGLDRSQLKLDKEYDIQSLGKEYGHIVLYIHDPEISIEQASHLLLEVRQYADAQSVPFHAIDFHLCEPRTEDGQYNGEEITLFDFLYTDITEANLTELIREHWTIAQEHYAIQDGIKNYPSDIFDKIKKISVNYA